MFSGDGVAVGADGNHGAVAVDLDEGVGVVTGQGAGHGELGWHGFVVFEVPDDVTGKGEDVIQIRFPEPAFCEQAHRIQKYMIR